ncbi:hypothetical protein caldi_28980 [Caldinitratiruptor microaerophilus]|uniref:Uncharacterized protein n=1 Tax=Caldinitratiruptor microaerophilus TaxID=671077 RepID=A0AA35CNQ8_9FIRM|nr:hypothetical protein caldi_28980 [Caldinitratiruptor microaerophilus]
MSPYFMQTTHKGLTGRARFLLELPAGAGAWTLSPLALLRRGSTSPQPLCRPGPDVRPPCRGGARRVMESRLVRREAIRDWQSFPSCRIFCPIISLSLEKYP